MDKWITVQATAALTASLEQIDDLRQHKDFDLINPNRISSLYDAVSQLNAEAFSSIRGRGYQLWC